MPIVESVGYYQAMIQAKIDDVSKEMERLRSETEMADVHSEPRMALDRRHDALLNALHGLEANLADYNLAREYGRSGTSPGDVKKSTLGIIGTNKKMEKEIDAVFFKRKKVEDEISSVEAEVARIHAVLESKILDGDDERMDDYRSSVVQVKAAIAETERQEDDIVLISHKLRRLESNEYRKEKKRVEGMKKQLEQVDEDITLAQMTDDEARERLLGKIVGFQLRSKELEEELILLENELKTLHDMQKKSSTEKLMGGAARAYERLSKKDNSLKQYLEGLPEMKTQLEEERARLLSNIETLHDDISKKEKLVSNMELPSKEEMELMMNDVAFTRKHLDANQETMAILYQQKTKLVDEVCTTLLVPVFIHC
jgi:structural maintenance of chromosome 4